MQLDIRQINKLVISLPNRSDRREAFIRNNIMGYFNWMDGVLHPEPYKGIAQAHLNCIRHAKAEGWDKVLIMEDDVEYPAKDKTMTYIDAAMAKLPDDWDIVLGGCYYLRNQHKVNNYWRKCGEFCALHWYIVNERVYDKILAYNETNHIDRWMGLQGFKIYLPHKLWAIQTDGFSDNVGRVTDYNTSYLTKFDILR